MQKARELARQEAKVRQSMEDAFKERSAEALKQLKHEIDFQAHLSGISLFT